MRDQAILAALAYCTAVIAANTEPLSDEQAIAYMVSAGLFGGFLAAIGGKDPITWRSLLVKVGASGMVAPGIVWFGMQWAAGDAEVHLRLAPVVALSGLGGLTGWPLSQLLLSVVRKIDAAEVWERIKGVLK